MTLLTDAELAFDQSNTGVNKNGCRYCKKCHSSWRKIRREERKDR